MYVRGSCPPIVSSSVLVLVIMFLVIPFLTPSLPPLPFLFPPSLFLRSPHPPLCTVRAWFLCQVPPSPFSRLLYFLHFLISFSSLPIKLPSSASSSSSARASSPPPLLRSLVPQALQRKLYCGKCCPLPFLYLPCFLFRRHVQICQATSARFLGSMVVLVRIVLMTFALHWCLFILFS